MRQGNYFFEELIESGQSTESEGKWVQVEVGGIVKGRLGQPWQNVLYLPGEQGKPLERC